MIKSRAMRWTGHEECMARREMHTGFWRETQRLGRPTLRREDNVRNGWIHLAENRDQWRVLVNTVKNIRVP
jgi:hypothetical protein